ncbi:MAG: 50S ribosomal protein L11 [Armatimonadetes bacterium]|nr:50S ribosomal protein L11 [Armatimonadota bacterium]
MAKKIVAEVTIQIPAGKAAPGPPVGPSLGAYGINLPLFIKEYNERSVREWEAGTIVPARVTIFGDRSYNFELKTPPAAVLIKKALGLAAGSASSKLDKKGTLSLDQLRQIATVKLPDLNTDDVEAAMRIIAGTCRQMGVDVEGETPGGDGG